MFALTLAWADPGCVGDRCETPAPVSDPNARNVLGSPLASCSVAPMTGWFRDGSCRTDAADRGSHTVCAVVDEPFLAATAARGNDLRTPTSTFPGLRPGDRWCLCAARWEEARLLGVAPAVVLDATDDAALRVVSIDELRAHASGIHSEP